MEYAMLPFAKFRNLNESAAYALPVVQEKISKASVVEFSEKLDGSMIQMRYTGDKRFWHGIMMGTSGSLHSTRAPQLQHVLEFMERKGERIEKLVRAFPHNTFMFEWIDPRDEHMVRYGKHGLHFIGARNTNVGWQWDYHTIIRYAGEYGVPTTSLFSLSIDEALASLEGMQGSEQEGYVLNIDVDRCVYVGSVGRFERLMLLIRETCVVAGSDAAHPAIASCTGKLFTIDMLDAVAAMLVGAANASHCEVVVWVDT
jgi:hypothetical protein